MALELPPTLEVGELLLRPATIADRSDVVAILSSTDGIAAWTRVPYPYTGAHFDEFLSGSWTDEATCDYLIERTGRIVGAIGARLDESTATAELGYWLAPEARGSGIATRAGRRLCAVLFAAGCERIEALVVAGNTPSAGVLSRLGFSLEGTRRSVLIPRLGLEDRRRDVDGWSLLPGELPRVS